MIYGTVVGAQERVRLLLAVEDDRECRLGQLLSGGLDFKELCYVIYTNNDLCYVWM